MRGLRIILALLLLTIAIPAIFAFEGMSAFTAVFLNRQTWYDVLDAPELYEQFIGQLETDIAETPAQRGAIRAAMTPEYVSAQFNTIVDYLFDILDGETPADPIFDVPESLVEAIRQNPNALNLQTVEKPDGSLGFVVDIGENRLEEVAGIGRQIAFWTVITATIGFLLWVVAASLGGDNARERFFWLGVTLIFASFGLVIIGTAGLNSVIPSLTNELTRNAEQLDALERAVSRSMLDVVPNFANALIFAGGIPCAFGLLLIVIGSVLRPKRA